MRLVLCQLNAINTIMNMATSTSPPAQERKILLPAVMYRARKKGSFYQRLSLLPYGDTLLTPGAGFWIASVRIAVFLMAAAEAVSWAYFGSFFSSGWISYVTAVAVGCAMFCIVWLIDASFVTLDTSRVFYEREIFGRQEETALQERVKFVSGLIGRVAIISASLAISAPFLALIVFQKDVDYALEEQKAAAIQVARDSVDAFHAVRLANADSLIQAAQGERIREVQGVSGSGRYGRGAAVETIEQVIADLQKQYQSLQNTREGELQRFDIADEEELARIWGVRLPGRGLQSHGEVLREVVLKNPTYRAADLAVKAFLGFLFFAIVILKVFAPRSIRIYYNEDLQDLYVQYEVGALDQYLKEHERSVTGTMSPMRFEHWCLSRYSAIRAEDERTTQWGAQRVRLDELLDTWSTILKATQEELNPLRARIDMLDEEQHALEEQIETRAAEIDALAESLQQDQTELRRMRDELEKGMFGADALGHAVRFQRELTNSVQIASAEIRQKKATVENMRRRLVAIKRNREEAISQAEAKETLVKDLDSKIQAERRRVVDVLSTS